MEWRKMKLTIFGGTGEAGRQLIEQALAEGNEVLVFARNPSKLTTHREHRTIIQGELHDLTNFCISSARASSF